MNKKYIGWILAVPAMLGFGMTSCSNDDLVGNEVALGQKVVDVEFTALLDNPTRSTLNPDGNIIKFEWETTDVVKVVNNSDGKFLANLYIKEINETDKKKCTFKGQLPLPESATGDITLKFYCLGKNSMKVNEDHSVNNLTIDFSSQDGTTDHFADNDILTAIGTFSLTNISSLNLGTLNFSRYFAYGRFILKYNGEDISMAGKTVEISNANGNLYNSVTLNYATILDPSKSKKGYFKDAFERNEGSIQIRIPARDETSETPAEVANDFYVSFIPSEAVELKFTVDMGDGTIFEGTKGKELLSNTYYTDGLSDGGPIVVEMNKVGGEQEKEYTLIYNANFGENPETQNGTAKEGTLNEYQVIEYPFTSSKPNCKFVGWNTQADGKGKDYAVDSDYTFDESSDVTTATLYAKWAIDYKATVKEDGKDPVVKTPNEGTTTITLDDLADKEGYEFEGWKEEGTNGPGIKGEWTLTEDKPQVTLVPSWKIKYILTYEQENGTVIGTDTQSSYDTPYYATVTDKFNSQVTIPAGYKLEGWYINTDTKKTLKDEVKLEEGNQTVILKPVISRNAGYILNGYNGGTLK